MVFQAGSPIMKVSCVPPSSMHPHLQLAIGRPPSQYQECELHVDLSLDDGIFLDVYELADLWGPAGFGETLGNGYPWSMTPPVSDLERPAYYPTATSGGERAQLHVSVSAKQLRQEGSKYIFDIPAHGRYQPPRMDGLHQREYTLGSSRDVADVPDGDFSAKWICKHLNGSVTSYVMATDESEPSCFLPVGDARHASLVEGGTMLAVGVAWLWVMCGLWRMMRPHKDIGKVKIKQD